VIESFGQHSGETALIAGYLADAHRTLISEVPFDVERLARLLLRDRASYPANYALVVVSEDASMTGGERIESGETDPTAIASSAASTGSPARCCVR